VKSGKGHALSKLNSLRAWTPAEDKAGEWLQLDLGTLWNVTGALVKGHFWHLEWVTKFKVSYSKDGQKWSDVAGEFDGPTGKTKAESKFPQPIEARYLRFTVVAWHKHITMRVAVKVCKVCQHMLFDTRDTWRNYSSTKDLVPHSRVRSGKAWSATKDEPGQWLQMDMGKEYQIVGTVLRGMSREKQWVTKYKVEYSTDGADYENLGSEFSGSRWWARNELPWPVLARYVRVIVEKWHKHISTRAAVLICRPKRH